MTEQTPAPGEFLANTPASRTEQGLKQYRRNAFVDVWIGGSENDRFDYPKRLVPVDRISARIANVAEELMIDSAINDPSIDNEDVVLKAAKYNADYVIPKDYWGDPERTHESIKSFLDYRDDYDLQATVIYPLQPPHDEHYYEWESFYAKRSHFAVGGLKDASPEAQLEGVKHGRNAVGPDKELHGLGMATTSEMVTALRENPSLLDSVDASTFERLPAFGKLAGGDWEQTPFPIPTGNSASTLNARATEFMVYQLVYQLSPLANDPKTDEHTADDQLTLEDSWTTSSEINSTADNEQTDESETQDQVTLNSSV